MRTEIEVASTGRICGHCQLCCKLLPVYDMRPDPKTWNTKCRHQRAGNHGCQVYHTVRPSSCKTWSCAWLVGAHTENVRRPDRSHYVIDMYLASFSITQGGKPREFKSIQVWLDPGYPNAWKDLQLFKFIDYYANAYGYATTIRLQDIGDTIILFPPAVSVVPGEWTKMECPSGFRVDNIKVSILKLGKEYD